MKKIIILLLWLSILVSSCVFADEINIAVASNFKYALQKLAADFKVKTGHDLRISSGSSGKLFAQIKHGAPYDIFFSADEKRPDLLIEAKKASAENSYIYALGKLVLMSNAVQLEDCKKILSSSRLRRLAIANPKIAPYGVAAKQVLQKLNLWQQLRHRLVMGENIAQTMQFVLTENAEAGFVAQSMLSMAALNQGKRIDKTCTWNIPTDMYSPIRQKMVLLNKAKSNSAAQAFVLYVRSAAAKQIIKSTGYDVL